MLCLHSPLVAIRRVVPLPDSAGALVAAKVALPCPLSPPSLVEGTWATLVVVCVCVGAWLYASGDAGSNFLAEGSEAVFASGTLAPVPGGVSGGPGPPGSSGGSSGGVFGGDFFFLVCLDIFF